MKKLYNLGLVWLISFIKYCFIFYQKLRLILTDVMRLKSHTIEALHGMKEWQNDVCRQLLYVKNRYAKKQTMCYLLVGQISF